MTSQPSTTVSVADALMWAAPAISKLLSGPDAEEDDVAVLVSAGARAAEIFWDAGVPIDERDVLRVLLVPRRLLELFMEAGEVEAWFGRD